jgi:hypothetical protein
MYKENLKYKIIECKNNVNEFWKLVKSINRKDSGPSCTITPEMWSKYFENLLNANFLQGQDENDSLDLLKRHEELCEDCNTGEPIELNDIFSLSEVSAFIKTLKNNKSPGIDGICNELLKNYVDIIGHEIVKLFNIIMQTGKFPSMWCKAILIPLHKGGCVNDQNNYRGISLLCSLGKVFTGILNQRLNRWAINQNLLYEHQAGFRSGRSTVDHIFTAYGVAEKYLCKRGGRLYFIFVDFAKAFDCVPHAPLFKRLINIGVHGKILKVLNSMYNQLFSCVQTPQGLTEMFKCHVGTRQGCMLSPFLFIIYLNKYIQTCNESCKGIYINEDFQNLNILLYADDMVQCSDMVGRLQHHLNVLSKFCYEYCMKVNLSKTKIMVFRNGGPLRNNEKWFYNSEKVETVSYYKYLGIVFSSRLKWSAATKTLAAQSSKALFSIKRMYYKCNGLPIDVAFELFDKMIVPILCYGSEVWGYKKYDVIEKVQLKFCKFLLGVNSTTNNSAVLGECGRRPLLIQYFCRCIKYWCKILLMDNDRLPKVTYIMLKKLDECGKNTWVTHIKNLLFKYGFGIVYISQDIGNIDLFIINFKQRITDCCYQEWCESLNNSSKLSSYCSFKSLLEPEKYLFCITVRKFKIALSKFRCSNHKLEIEAGRINQIDIMDRICKYCELNGYSYVENEYHFICKCPQYDELRKKYLHHTEFFNSDTFIKLFSTTNVNVINNLSQFIFYSNLKREQFLTYAL